MILRYTKECAVAFLHGLLCGRVSRRECIRKEKQLREQLSERQIDRMLEDTFPASDPLSTY